MRSVVSGSGLIGQISGTRRLLSHLIADLADSQSITGLEVFLTEQLCAFTTAGHMVHGRTRPHLDRRWLVNLFEICYNAKLAFELRKAPTFFFLPCLYHGDQNL